jgi:Pro-kumamolisin, activation domain/Divergent InlB B-repeat domain
MCAISAGHRSEGTARELIRLAALASIFPILVLVCAVSLHAQQAVAIPATPYAIQAGSATLMGHYDPQQMLRLVLALRPPHMQQEEEFLRELQDPGSPHFHQFLSETEWNDRFAPTAQDELAVVTWAQSQGLTITQRYPNRLLVDVEAPVATIEQAFNVTINGYQIAGEAYFSNDRDPSIPVSLAHVLQGVLGLNNVQRMRSASTFRDHLNFPVYSPGPAYTVGTHIQQDASREKSKTTTNTASKQDNPYYNNSPYAPANIYSSYAYNYAALSSLGHCCNPLNNPGNSPPEASIAIVIAGNFADADFNGFIGAYNLAGNVQKYQVDGAPPCCSAEATLDAEWTTAMANSFGSSASTAEINVYETPNDAIPIYLDAINRALTDGHARVLSISWGGAEIYGIDQQSMTNLHNVFNQMIGEGWSIMVAAGDHGSTTGCQDHVAVSNPASDPDVTAVGGTTLDLNYMQYLDESAWTGGSYGCAENDGGTGGGCSAFFSAPGYQGGAACSNGMRSVPDIALNSDGVNAPQYFFYLGQLYPTGGTSIAAPEMAGFAAQENAYLLYIGSLVGNTCGPSLSAPCAPAGAANSYLYNEGLQPFAPHYPFYDITQGCNNNDITQRYNLPYFCAGAGYDRVTGWGSANMLQLAWMINYTLAGDGVGPSASFSGPPVNHWYNVDQTVTWSLTGSSGNGRPPNGVAGYSDGWDTDPGDPYSEPTPGAGNSYYELQSNASNGSLNGLSQLSQACHYAYIRGWDNAGNSALSTYGPLCFDNVPPVTAISLSGNGQGGNYNGPVLVSLAATDNASGVAVTEYVVDSGLFQPYSGPFYVYLPGYHQVTAYSVDVAGNVEQLEYVDLTIQQNQQFTVTVNVSGTGSGTVTSSDGQIHCGTTCSGSYYDEQPITLTASAAQGSVFIGWQNCDLSFGLSCTATITQARTITAIFNIPVAWQFVPLTPCRVVDTRGANGPFGGPTLQGGTERDFALPSNPTCPGIPSSAAAYSLNVTAVPHVPLNYLTIWSTGLTQPNISTLNSGDGRVKANAAIVPAGSNASVSVYVTNTSDVLLDIDGYFIPSSTSTLAFFTLPPCRIVDTRGPNGPLGGPYLLNQQTRDFPILQASSCNIPSAAQAYSLNVTALPRNRAPLGYLTVWPNGQNMPVVSTLNAYTGAVTANAALVPAGTNGDIEVYPYGADTDLLIDIDGYFAPASSGSQPLSLYDLASCRVLDTRGGNGAFMGEMTVNVVGSACQAPSVAQGYIMNATVVPVGILQYLTLWPEGQPQPMVSTLNAYDGAVTSNMAIVPTMNGSIDAYASDPTQLLLDISSYFAP